MHFIKHGSFLDTYSGWKFITFSASFHASLFSSFLSPCTYPLFLLLHVFFSLAKKNLSNLNELKSTYSIILCHYEQLSSGQSGAERSQTVLPWQNGWHTSLIHGTWWSHPLVSLILQFDKQIIPYSRTFFIFLYIYQYQCILLLKSKLLQNSTIQ